MYKKLLFLCVAVMLFVPSVINAQQKDPYTIYRSEREKINNLVHTKLKVDFNFKEQELNGEAWITLTPHFYPTKKLTLDAKAMRIEKIQLGFT